MARKNVSYQRELGQDRAKACQEKFEKLGFSRNRILAASGAEPGTRLLHEFKHLDETHPMNRRVIVEYYSCADKKAVYIPK